MNVQTHTSGPISGQVPNQAGSQMPVLSQHNGNALAPQMQNLGGPARVMSNMDPELLSARQIVQDRICQIIRQFTQPMNDRKFRDIAKKLDEGLFRSSQDKDDYMNPETLESRLHNLIKRPPNQSQQYQQAVNSSSPAGMVIPTPGMSHSGNSNMLVTSSMDVSMNTTRGSTGIAPTTVNTGNLVPTGALHGGSFNRSDGSMSNGYQQSPANLSVGAGGNISSVGVQRMASQMIPTPGCNSSNNHSYMNLNSSSNGGGFCTVDSLMVTQPQQQQQRIGGQNSSILHSLGGQINTGIRSGMQEKSYGLPNEALNCGLGFGNSLPVVNESGTSAASEEELGDSSQDEKEICEVIERFDGVLKNHFTDTTMETRSSLDEVVSQSYYRGVSDAVKQVEVNDTEKNKNLLKYSRRKRLGAVSGQCEAKSRTANFMSNMKVSLVPLKKSLFHGKNTGKVNFSKYVGGKKVE